MAASQSATSSPGRRAHGQTPSVADFLCPICLQLLVEPVVMPCNHELCRDCFRQNVEEANLVCPLCRKRISSWARKSARDGTLVDQKRWQLIQKLFPERCKKRLQGEDDDDTDYLPKPKRLLSSAGEVRKEYEEEIKKIHEAEEAENKASEDLIRKLQEVERKQAEEMERQRQEDEKLALNLSQENIAHKIVLPKPQISPRNQVVSGKTKGKSKPTTPAVPVKTLHQWFSPVRKASRSSTSSDSDTSCGEASESKGQSSEETSLSPETHKRAINPTSNLFTEYEQQYFRSLEEKRLQEEHDMKVARELQKQLDKESRVFVNRQRGTEDAYSLRGAGSGISAKQGTNTGKV